MNMQLLEKILTAYGPSGHEGRVAEIIRGALEGHVDELRTDVMGNLIAVRHGDGTGKRIMLAAHMDHIGLAVIDADKNGYLRVCSVGGVDAGTMVSGHVAFENGVCGVVFADEKIKGTPKVSELYVDIGAQTREEALDRVSIGDMCVMKPRVTKLGEHRLASPAMDDRISCYIQAQALLEQGFTMDELRHMNDDFVRENLSPGGSADLLAVTIFLYEIQNTNGGEQI